MSGRDWNEWERFGGLIEKAAFRFARTMPENPHFYTLRRTWERDADFEWAVNYLNRHGYETTWKWRKYIQIDVNGFFYWTMGYPAIETILINRKEIQAPATYDILAAKYDTLYRSPAEIEENRVVLDFALVARARGLGSVLDVGCGNGMVLDMASEYPMESYLGLEPSRRMLDFLKIHHPEARTVHSSFRSFCPPQAEPRFDTVLALFGVGSYLDEDELQKLLHLCKPGGRVVAMFYKPGYEPDLYKGTGVRPLVLPWVGQFPGCVHEVGNHVLVVHDKP